MSGSKGGPYGKGSIMTGAELSRLTIESQGELIDKLTGEILKLKSELTAQKAETDFWHGNFDRLMNDTKRRVRSMIERSVQMPVRTEPEVSRMEPGVSSMDPAVILTEPEASDTTHSGH